MISSIRTQISEVLQFFFKQGVPLTSPASNPLIPYCYITAIQYVYTGLQKTRLSDIEAKRITFCDIFSIATLCGEPHKDDSVDTAAYKSGIIGKRCNTNDNIRVNPISDYNNECAKNYISSDRCGLF